MNEVVAYKKILKCTKLTKEISHNQFYLSLYLEISSDQFRLSRPSLGCSKKQNSTVEF